MTNQRLSVAKLLRPRTVAIVGASSRTGTFSLNLLRSLRSHAYNGVIYPVNPRYDAIEGLPCYPSLSELPTPPDCVLYALADKNLLAALEESAAVGVPGGVVFGRAYGSDAGGRDLQKSIAAIGRAAGMSICGANCMGYLNLLDGLQVTGMPFARLAKPSGISLISHSGSTWAGLVGNQREIGFDFAISAGQELVTTMGHYIDFLLDIETTRAIVCIVETVRCPELFLSAAHRADQMGIPIIALKLGRSEDGKRFAVSHSGAMSGAAEVYDAVFSAQNVIQVRTLDELLDTVELFANPRRPRNTGVGIGTDSGGERQLIVDLASDIGLRLPELAQESSKNIKALLDPGMEAANPLDYWGDGGDVMAPCLSLVAEDASIGTVVMASNMPPGRPFVAQCTDAVISVFRHTQKPVALLGNIATTMASEALSRVRAEGIPVLMGTDTGLRALTHFTTYLPRQAKPLALPVEADCEKVRQWKGNLDKIAGYAVSSAGGFDLLAAFDIQSAPFVRITSESDLKTFVKAQTLPVVLKIDDPAIPHKSEVGGLILNISSEQKAIEGYRRLKDRHPEAPMLAQVQLTGYELILGMTTDEDFGPMVTIGLGGIYAEIFKDSVVLPPPIDRNSARQALESLRCFPILAGARGKTPADIDALLHAIECFGRLAMSVKGMVSEIEINPVIARENDAFAVDCLVSMSLGEPNER